MDVATTGRTVGVRELKNELSRYLHLVQDGGEVIVTDRGRPVARLSPIDHSFARFARLVDAGVVRPPQNPDRRRPPGRIKAAGMVSDLLADQRR